MEELISFSDLMKQADKVAEKTEKYTNIGVNYRIYESGNKKLKYNFYQAGFRPPVEFATVQELQQAMENIINPPEDQGVAV